MHDQPDLVHTELGPFPAVLWTLQRCPVACPLGFMSILGDEGAVLQGCLNRCGPIGGTLSATHAVMDAQSVVHTLLLWLDSLGRSGVAMRAAHRAASADRDLLVCSEQDTGSCESWLPAWQVEMYPSKSDGMFVPESLIFRSDSNGEDLEGYAGAGLYDSITMDPTELRKVDYASDRCGRFC